MYAIILAGGSGTRLWPLSRENHPKQFLNLFGKQSLLSATIERLGFGFDASKIIVVANVRHREIVLEESRGLPRENIIFESSPRGTAGALGLGVVTIARRDPQATFVLINSDHVISNAREYNRKIRLAEELTKKYPQNLILIGVKPTYPETGYGYIKVGRPIKSNVLRGRDKLFAVNQFVEKPDAACARKYLRSGKYLWNLTLIVGRVGTLLDAYSKYLPRHAKLLRNINRYDELRVESVDYGLLEKMKNLLVLSADFPWVDVGHWRAVRDVLARGKDKNIIRGNVVALGGKGNLLLNTNHNKIVATVGINNCVVIETPEALLVCHLPQAQEVKKIANLVKNK